MGFCFSSPKKKDVLADSNQILADNARVLSVCVELAEGELRKNVERLYDEIGRASCRERVFILV